jgi:hypothetical protein
MEKQQQITFWVDPQTQTCVSQKKQNYKKFFEIECPRSCKRENRILKTFLRFIGVSVTSPIHEREKRIFLKFLEFVGVRETVHPAARVSPHS